MDGLRQKLESQGLENVAYMVVNHQGEQSQRLHSLLKLKLSENITLYQQSPDQADVWEALAGEKDDFLIYDRCGRLTYHISLPYSILGTPYVEDAIRDTYCKRVCGDCNYESVEIPAECNRTVEASPEVEETPGHHHGHDHGHGHGHHGNVGHGEGHGHHGGRREGHGHGHHGNVGNGEGHGHHGDRREGHGHGHGHAAPRGESEGQQQHPQKPLDLGQVHMGQQALHHGQMQQAAEADQVRQRA